MNYTILNNCPRLPKKYEVSNDIYIDPSAIINVSEYLSIGHGTKILAHTKIEGRSVIIGRECFIHEYSWIGGGGSFDNCSDFICGDWMHLGRFAHINTAESVVIGDQVGIGHMSSLWTHGGYLPVDLHYPHEVKQLTIGNNVWLPHAWVNPGVNIGSNVVVAAMSLINKDVPDQCFVAGIPAKIRSAKIVEYPFQYIVGFLTDREIKVYSHDDESKTILMDSTEFHLKDRRITGRVTPESERAKDLLRRVGIRFKYKAVDGQYHPWEG